MALPLLLIFNAGRIVSIAVRAGSALSRFIWKNQKIIAEITTNPNTSIQKIIAENPKIIEQILKRI